MGYYSTMALKVTREDTTHGIPMTDLWKQYLANNVYSVETAGFWQDEVEVSDNEWKFYADGVRWYVESAGYDEVRFINDWRERMLTFVEMHPKEYTYSWVIIGEDEDDVESQYRGDKNDYSLAPRTTIVGL